MLVFPAETQTRGTKVNYFFFYAWKRMSGDGGASQVSVADDVDASGYSGWGVRAGVVGLPPALDPAVSLKARQLQVSLRISSLFLLNFGGMVTTFLVLFFFLIWFGCFRKQYIFTRQKRNVCTASAARTPVATQAVQKQSPNIGPSDFVKRVPSNAIW